LAACF